MKLDDLLRETTHDPRETIRILDDEIERAKREQVAADERIKRIGTEIKKRRADEPTVKRDLAGLRREKDKVNAQLDEIEETRRALIQERAELESRIAAVQNSHASVVDTINDLQKEIEQENLRKAQAEREEKQRSEEMSRAVGLLRDARVRGVQEYLSQMDGHLHGIVRTQTLVRQHRLAFESLNKDRHERKEVADLWDAREEWKKIVRSVAVPAVVAAAKAELAKIESKLNQLYPGALDAESLDSGHDVFELFYCTRGTRLSIPLPVPESAWGYLGRGENELHDELRLRLIWQLVKQTADVFGDSSVAPEKTSFGTQQGVPTMYYNIPDGSSFEPCSVDLELRGGLSIYFILVPFPTDVEEAFFCDQETV